MSEVGALIISLQLETAQLREDMGKVKNHFKDLKDGADEAGEGMENSMGKARGGVMLLEEAVGVKLPRHLNSLIAQIPGVGAAFATMLPVIGIVAAITIIAKLVEKHDELIAKTKEAASAAESLALQQDSESRALTNTSLKLDDQIRKLEHKPAHNFLREASEENAIAMDKYAETAINDLAKVEKSATEAFGIMHLLSLIGSNLFQGHSSDVSDYANKLKMLGVVADTSQGALDALAKVSPTSPAHKAAVDNAIAALRTYAKASTDAANAAKLVGDNVAMVGFAEAARTANHQIADLNQQLTIAGQRSKVALGEQAKENLIPLQEAAELSKTVAEGVVEEEAARQKLNKTIAEGVAIGTGSKDNDDPEAQFTARHKLNEKMVEDAKATAATEMAAKSKQYDLDYAAAGNNTHKKEMLLAELARAYAAIDAKVKQQTAESNTQDIAAYTECEKEKRQRAMAAAAETANGVMEYALKAAQAREKQADQEAKNLEALHRKTSVQTLAAEVANSKAATSAEVHAYNDRIKALDKFDKDYLKKVQEFQAKIKAAEKKGDDDVTSLKVAAAQKQAMAVKEAEDKMANAVATDVAKSIAMNKNMAQAFRQTGEELIEGMIKNLIMMELTGDKEKLIHAKGAFHKSYDWASSWGGPIAGNVAGALAFATVMSFEVGGKIPGSSGPVPIMGHAGETVVTKALTDRVEKAEGNGGNGGGMTMHNSFAPHIHAVDATGVDAMLTKHGAIFQKHMTSVVRRMNR